MSLLRDFFDPFPGDGFCGEEPYDGLRLEVFGQYSATQYDPGEDEVCISISCRNWGIKDPPLSPKFIDILRLDYADTEVNPEEKTISDVQADIVAEFVWNHRNRKKIVVHCFAGINRSRSTAEAIAEALKLPFRFTVNNKSVYTAVFQALKNIRNNYNAGVSW